MSRDKLIYSYKLERIDKQDKGHNSGTSQTQRDRVNNKNSKTWL